MLHQYYDNYDAAANRTSEQIDSNVTQTSVSNLNQITAQSAGGATRFQGIISQPGTVTVNGQPATMPTSTNFVANPTLSSGTNTVTVVATNGNGAAQTNQYQVVVPSGASVTPSYDAAGNMTNNGNGQTYEWDAENRLIQIAQGSNTYQFAYDGLDRRVSETDNGTLIKQWVWVGSTMAEERNGSGAVTKRFYPQGEQITGSAYYYSRDHLGSVREMTDSTGATLVRNNYDPYGRVTATGIGTHVQDVEAGTHWQAFQGATATLSVGTGATMVAYVYCDPNHPPSEVEMSWEDSSLSFEHRAYWGSPLVGGGTNGTNSMRYMGPLPPTGQWVRLEVPASQVGLEGITVIGAGFNLYNGSATWNHSGMRDSSGNETVWIGDSLPTGAEPFTNNDTWTWTQSGLQSDFQYAGYYTHVPSTLNLTLYRAYDPNTARWLSRDPYVDKDGNDAELILGPNLYTYVRNSPINGIDGLGLVDDIGAPGLDESGIGGSFGGGGDTGGGEGYGPVGNGGGEAEPEPAPPKPAPASPNLPSDARSALNDIEGGVPRPNVRAPKPFANDGRGGTAQLPCHTAAGQPIKYTEYTVNPRPPGGTLDAKRIVIGNDGSIYYTGDHFSTFVQVK